MLKSINKNACLHAIKKPNKVKKTLLYLTMIKKERVRRKIKTTQPAFVLNTLLKTSRVE